MPRPIDQKLLDAALAKLREVRDGANADVEYKRRLSADEAREVLAHLFDLHDARAKAERGREAARERMRDIRAQHHTLAVAARAIGRHLAKAKLGVIP